MIRTDKLRALYNLLKKMKITLIYYNQVNKNKANGFQRW